MGDKKTAVTFLSSAAAYKPKLIFRNINTTTVPIRILEHSLPAQLLAVIHSKNVNRVTFYGSLFFFIREDFPFSAGIFPDVFPGINSPKRINNSQEFFLWSFFTNTVTIFIFCKQNSGWKIK